MNVESRRINKIILYGIVILLLGAGILSIIPVSASSDTKANSVDAPQETRSSSARSINLYSTLELWDDYINEPHDGTFGDNDIGDYYSFFIGSSVSSFVLDFKNINEEGRLRYINTTLKTTTESANVITITEDEYVYSSSMYPGYERSFYYAFNIEPSAKIQSYKLALDIEYTYINDQMQHHPRSGTIYIYIQLSTRIGSSGSGYDLELVGTNQYSSNLPIYSGARNQMITFPYCYSRSSDLEDLEFTLNLPSEFTLNTKSAALDELDTNYNYNENPMWTLTDSGGNDLLSKVYEGSFDVSYKLNNQPITENQIPVTIEIVNTPILNLDGQVTESEIGSKSKDEYITNYAIYQGTTTETFSLKFFNDGNIDLLDVEVELYTDNAAFFFNSNFYYDESNQAKTYSYGNIIDFGDIAVGNSATKSFSTDVIKNLPPGIYKIPIRYTAKYNTGGYFDQELSVFDYHDDITAARATDNEGYRPFLLIEVKEGDDSNDNQEPDLQAKSSTYLQKGAKNVQLEVELTNMENYLLSDVTAKIDTGSSSPLRRLNVNNGSGDVESQENGFNLYAANDQIYSNKYTVTFAVDVSKNALWGAHDIPITVTCLDPFNQQRTTQTIVTLNINSVPPNFIISDITAEEIIPNEFFTLTVKIYNTGGCDANNVRVMFNGSSNLFSAKESYQEKGTIRMNEEAEFIFVILSNEVEPGNFYSLSIMISYEDEAGNIYPFDSENEQIINLRAKTVEEKEEEETEFIDVMESLSMIFLGIFILIGIIIFSFFHYRAAKGDFPVKEKKEKKRFKNKSYAPPQQLPATQSQVLPPSQASHPPVVPQQIGSQDNTAAQQSVSGYTQPVPQQSTPGTDTTYYQQPVAGQGQYPAQTGQSQQTQY